jgi:hypothetical protein
MNPMKLKNMLLLTVALAGSTALCAADKIVAGPKGGRLLETETPKIEFFVTKDRKVEINFYDAALKPVDPGSRVVAVIAEPKSGRTPLDLEQTAHGFVSKDPLPEGEPYRVVVQVRDQTGARPRNFRLEYDMAECGGCGYAEYACICGH